MSNASPPPLPQAPPLDVPYATVDAPYATLDPAPAAAELPMSVRVLGILGLVFGGMAVLGPLRWLVDRHQPRGGAATMPAFVALMESGPLATWNLVATLVTAVVGVALVRASVGALRLRPRARRQMLACAAAMILAGVVLLIAATLWLVPAVSAALAGADPATRAFVLPFVIVFSVVTSGLWWLAYPACVIVYFRRPSVVAAFERAGATDVTV